MASRSGKGVACFVAAALTFGAAGAAFSQDTNYWTLQYGTRGELLGGMVVGSAVDLSATYYNPGSLALVKDPSTILTATVLGMETIKVKEAKPSQDVVWSRRIGPEPSMFAGSLPLHWFDGQMAYSFLTRQKLDFRLIERDGAVIAVDVPGDTLSIGGELIFDEEMGEQWGGLTWAKKANDRIGYGLTVYGAYRSQHRSLRQTVEAFGGSGYGAAALEWTDVDFSTFRLLAKLGISANLGSTSVGLAFTTRSLPIFGSGTILINRSIIGDTDPDGTGDSRSRVSYGKDVHADYRSPFSIALGTAHRWERTTLHIAMEYFMSLDPYTVIESEATGNSPGVTSFHSAFQCALDDVFNWGVGVERKFSEKTTAYISFITDRSASRRVRPYDISVSTWDIYHLNGGVAFAIGGTDLTIGGGFAWGSQPIQIDPVSAGVLPPTFQPAEVSYSRIKAILGIAL